MSVRAYGDNRSELSAEAGGFRPRGIGFIGALIALVFLASCVLYFETARSMVQVWAGSRTFTHGFLAFPIVGFLIWQERAEAGLMFLDVMR